MVASQAIPTQGTQFLREDPGNPGTFVQVEDTVSFVGPDGERAEIDITHLLSTSKEYLLGLRDKGNITLSLNYVPAGTVQQALIADEGQDSLRNFKAIFTDVGLTELAFAANVKKFAWTVNPDSKVEVECILRISGDVTVS